jgi:carbon storage regulator
VLVLSRKPNERILIGSDIKITVIRIGPNSVRIGIDAPDHLNIVREEIAVRQGELTTAGAVLDIEAH